MRRGARSDLLRIRCGSYGTSIWIVDSVDTTTMGRETPNSSKFGGSTVFPYQVNTSLLLGSSLAGAMGRGPLVGALLLN